MKNLMPWILMLLFFSISDALFSQSEPDSSRLYRVETKDGNEFLGLLESQDSLKVVLSTQSLGKISILRSTVKSMTPVQVSNLKSGKLWIDNAQATRYFWSPNGYGLKKGEGYYQNIWVLWNQASIGVTDYFSVGAGLIPLFFFGEGSFTPVWIVPKLSIPIVKDKFNLGAGALAGKLLGQKNSGFGIVYGLGTVGNRNNNMTLGFGYGYAAGNWAKLPLITLSGMTRVGPRGYLLTENYFFGSGTANFALLSFGGRTMVKRAGLDYGLFFPVSSDIGSFIAIPWLGMTASFGKK